MARKHSPRYAGKRSLESKLETCRRKQQRAIKYAGSVSA